MKEHFSLPNEEMGRASKSAGDYEAPATLCSSIETEGSFCGSVVKEKEKQEIKATGHELGDTYDFSEQTGWE